jgi:hypothetical protein
MFGMEKQKKGKKGEKEKEIYFDIEEDIVSDPANYKKLKTKVRERVQLIKTALRSGADKKNFDSYGVLLHGYVSLQKVIAKVNKKSR